jgi:hypothetical protein
LLLPPRFITVGPCCTGGAYIGCGGAYIGWGAYMGWGCPYMG